MPTPTVFVDHVPYASGYVISEANHDRSRDTLLLAAGEKVVAGQVLGADSASGELKGRDATAGDGSEVAVAISYRDVDNSAGALPVQIVVHSRDMEANEQLVSLVDSATLPADKDSAITELAAVGIILRAADVAAKVFPL